MKLKKSTALLIVVTLMFVRTTAGFLIGDRQLSGFATVITQYSDPTPLVRVSISDAEDDPEPPETARSADAEGTSEDACSEPSELININTASTQELTALPGVGEVIAERIVNYREAHGAFVTIYDITAVSGIGDGKFEKMKDFITTGEAAG